MKICKTFDERRLTRQFCNVVTMLSLFIHIVIFLAEYHVYKHRRLLRAVRYERYDMATARSVIAARKKEICDIRGICGELSAITRWRRFENGRLFGRIEAGGGHKESMVIIFDRASRSWVRCLPIDRFIPRPYARSHCLQIGVPCYSPLFSGSLHRSRCNSLNTVVFNGTILFIGPSFFGSLEIRQRVDNDLRSHAEDRKRNFVTFQYQVEINSNARTKS